MPDFANQFRLNNMANVNGNAMPQMQYGGFTDPQADMSPFLAQGGYQQDMNGYSSGGGVGGLRRSANKLASYGRRGDNVLVHMSRDELKALQHLNSMSGIGSFVRGSKPLPINPKTGLPEAFSLGGILPIVAAIASQYILPGNPFLAAAMAGGSKAITGGNINQVLGSSLMGGAGSMLGSGLESIGSEAAASALTAEGTAISNQAAEAAKAAGNTFDANAIANNVAAANDATIAQNASRVYPTADVLAADGLQTMNTAQMDPTFNAFGQDVAPLTQQEVDAKMGTAPPVQAAVASPPPVAPSFDFAKAEAIQDAANAVQQTDRYKELSTGNKARGIRTLLDDPTKGKRLLMPLAGVGIGTMMSNPGMLGGQKPVARPAYNTIGTIPMVSPWSENVNYSVTDGSKERNYFPGDRYGGVRTAAHGGEISGGIRSLPGTYAAGGKLLRGLGDGVSDSIPAVITGPRPQKAALADGEFVLDARTVSEIGNGSTEAGARRLRQMVDRIHAKRKTAKRGGDSGAHRMLPA